MVAETGAIVAETPEVDRAALAVAKLIAGATIGPGDPVAIAKGLETILPVDNCL